MCIRDRPMSILIPIAAYGPYIASFIEAQGIADPTSVMVRSIGFNFYCIMAVVGVAVFTLLHIEYGPIDVYKRQSPFPVIFPDGTKLVADIHGIHQLIIGVAVHLLLHQK